MTELARYRIETQGHLRGLPPDEIQRALLLDEILFALLGGPERAEWRLVELKTAQWPEEAWAALIDGVRTARAGVSPEERGAGWDAIRGALGGWRNEAWYELAVIDAERFDRLLAMTPDQFDAFLKSNRLAAGDMDKVAREVVAYAKIRCPILAVWGENDEFLPPHVSAAFLRSCLAGTGHHDATYEIVPGASHILTTSADDATFAAGYPSLLTDWVSERFGASATP
jgi:pimeloyl-ACP methyl ester carboxylesterase